MTREEAARSEVGRGPAMTQVGGVRRPAGRVGEWSEADRLYNICLRTVYRTALAAPPCQARREADDAATAHKNS